MAIGLYGPEYLQFQDGGPAREVRIFVFLPGTKIKAQLFADKSGMYTGPNPLWTDHRGELVFFAEVGSYDLYYEFPGEQGTTIAVEISTDAVVDIDTYVHVQNIASDVWNILHGLGVKPHVIVEESTSIPDDITYPAIRYIDENNVQLRWGFPASGRATCRR